MFGNRRRIIALSAAVATICSALPVIAAKSDGSWTMVAQTTRGHCGTIEVGLAISRGRIHSTGGSFAFYPINMGGRVSSSGRTSLRAVAGPRLAHGAGRFSSVGGSGTWSGTGPSGRCSGVWSATRS
jgi:hypothetical protein